MALAWSLAQLTASALPLVRTTTSGLPVAATASIRSSSGFGQVERGAVAALEAGLLHLHLFAFEFAGDADDGNDDVSGFGGGDGSGLGFQIDERPDEFSAGFEFWPGAKSTSSLAGLAGFKMDAANLGIDAVVVPGRGYVFAVETDAEEAVGDEAEVVLAGGGSSEVGLPKNGERVDTGGCSGQGAG
jgi:hypothetical protein